MATTQLASGCSPLDVQRQMGHKTLTMTNRYASLSVKQLQQSHDMHSPLRVKNVIGSEALGTGYWDVD
jgi:site-specific recombinase XerD